MNQQKHYHLVGIGGIGMSGIARLLLERGNKVSGSDPKENEITRGLKEAGAVIFLRHAPENIDGAEALIYSSAISADNPEVVEARRKGLPVIKRAQALAELMRDRQVITVSGSHGKTTTTSLVSFLLLEAGLNPCAAIGGILRNTGSNTCCGSGDFFVAEADESDGSFLYYQPKYSIITNIDREHLDYYKNFDNELKAFEDFIAKTRQDGVVLACYDDENLRKLTRAYQGRHIFFGLSPEAEVHPGNIEIKGLASEFDYFRNNSLLGRFKLALGGKHNISNALAVITLGLELGIKQEVIKRALAAYKGAGRRLEVKVSADNFTLIDDYAHHPSEIKATLAALGYLKAKRIVAVFQPHRYTRTQLLLDEFGESFDQADAVIITDIYPAGEKPIAGVSAKDIYDKIRKRSPDKEIGRAHV